MEHVYTNVEVGPRAVAMRTVGDSMSPAFLPGDDVIVDPDVYPVNGEVAVVVVNGQPHLGLFFEYDDRFEIKPTNNHYPYGLIRKNSKVRFTVIGKVVDVVRHGR